MKKFFMAVIAFMMTLSASAQFYIYFSDGTVAQVDSISMIAPAEKPNVGIGTFSVSETLKVTFSPGNLQYQGSTKKWRFAVKQTDFIGNPNINISAVYDGWIDLFGWGTGNYPTKSSTDAGDYSTFVDWGTNKIGNDAPNTWRTLTNNEWDYVMFDRANASSLVGVANVDGVNGLILLPDGWVCPQGVTFKSGYHSDYSMEAYGKYQTFTAEQWSKFESAGAVFLPAAGNRYGTDVYGVQDDGGDWSATEYNSFGAYSLHFGSDGASMYDGDRSLGQSVRLVKDL